jgi:hypothetical protein
MVQVLGEKWTTALLPMTISEACVKGAFYKIASGRATVATDTDIPAYVACDGADASTLDKFYHFIDITNEICRVPLSDVAADCFNVVTTSDGAADGTTLVDTDRTEIDDYWNGTFVYCHELGEYAYCSDFDAASDTATFSPGFSKQIKSGYHYSCTVQAVGVTSADISNDGLYVVNEDTTGGQLEILEVHLDVVGDEHVIARARSEA